jgi:hypothetical protein
MKIFARLKHLALTAALLFVLGCSGSSARAFASGITSAEAVTLFEGLPHGGFEGDKLESERRSKPVVELHGYSFYKELLDLRPEDAKRLTEILGDAEALKSFSGEKKCGGFHPDYAAEWKRGASSYQALICFGCNEVKLFGPDIESRHDLSDGANEKLEALLGGYRKNRPPPEH